MIDLNIIGKKYGPIENEHSWKDAVLYALGIGAGTGELSFIYERAEGGQKVFPTFAVVLGYDIVWEMMKDLKADFSRFIHGEQSVTMYGVLPPEGKTRIEGSVSDIYDKGKGALIRWNKKVMTEQGELLCEVESNIFYVGEGGFGGDPGPKAEKIEPPENVRPDFSTAFQIPENQAALYRLTGDINPLHLDPMVARKGGFERPILHGLCTYGIASRAVIMNTCGEDVRRFKHFKARFSGVVYPGDILVTDGWKSDDGSYLIQSRTDRGPVLSRAVANVVNLRETSLGKNHRNRNRDRYRNRK